MALNVGIGSKDAFKELRKLTPQKRVDYVNQQGAATILTMLTPAEFAELFPKYYQKALPDVGGFREAISRKSRQKQDDINYGLSQGAKSLDDAEKMGRTRDSAISNPVMARDIYNYLRTKYNMDHVHAMGILANIQGESRFNSGALNPDDRGGPSGGLFQFHDQGFTGRGRFSQMKAYVGDDWKTNWRKQIDYAMTEGEMKTYLSRSFTDEKDAVRGFVYDFEKPLDKVGDSIKRQGYLNSINSAVSGAADDTAVSSTSSKSGGFYGHDEQCVALSKHFSGLGAASGWKVKSGNISAGTVIATMSYNDGTGGKMAKDMPDGKSHYHTGIALTSPNEKGEVLILEQFAGQPARVRSININNYNGERWGVVEGGEPNAGTMKAVEIGRSLANQDQLAWIQSSTGGAAEKTGKPSVEVKPTQQAGVAKPSFTTNDQAPQYPEQQQQQAPGQTAKVEKPDKTKKTFETYKFDPDKYWKEVTTKQPLADSFMYGKDKVMKMTYDGFQEAQAAGAIKWNRKTNEIQVLDPNHESVQKIYKDMQDNNIDRNQFLSRTEAGGSGTAKVNGAHKHSAAKHRPDMYAPEVSSSGLSKNSKLVDYDSSIAAKEIGVTREQFNAFREAKASIESSGGKYALRGGSHDRFSGAYQLGGDEIRAAATFLKEEAPVMKAQGKRKPVANEDFINDPNMQERYHEAYTVVQHRQLMKNKKYASMSPEERLKVLGIAHNAGAGGASHWVRTGKVKSDAFGTNPEKYASRVGKQLSGLQTAKAEEAASKVKIASQTAQPVKEGVKEKVATAPVQEKKTVTQRLQEMIGTASAEPTLQQSAPGTSTKETFDRMRQLSTTTPAQKPLPDKMDMNIQPTDDKAIQDFLMDKPIDKHSSVVPQEKLQSPVVIDSFMKQHTTGFMSPSLERAMNRTRGHESDMNANRINTGTSIS